MGAQKIEKMSRKKMVILPKLNDAGGDISKKWFVYYSVRNPRTDKMERFKIFSELGKAKSKNSRYQVAESIIEEYTDKLKIGWTPFDADKSGIIYEDELTYAVVSEIYKKKRSNNSTIHYFASKLIIKVKDTLEPESLRNYKSVLRRFISWTEKMGISENDISYFTQPIIADFFHFLIDDLKRSARTVRRYRNLLYSLFEIAINDKKILVNPMYELPGTSRINDQAPRPIKDEDIKLFFKELKKEPQLYLAALIQMYCFIRPGNELLNLKIQHIDWNRRTIRVQKGFSKVHRERVVSIPKFLCNMMQENFKLDQYKHDFYIFSTDGKPGLTRLNKNTLRKKFNKIRDKLNMPDSYKFYSWKHTGGVMAADLGIPLSDIQVQMGHKNIATTLEYLKNHGAFRNNRFDEMEDPFNQFS